MKTCLIVDDVEVSRYTAGIFLSEMGYDSVEAPNEKQAKEMLKNRKVDVVLLDWHLRKQDSFELLAYIKKQYPATPVIMFSGVEGAESKKKALDAGALDFITKPTARQHLESAFKKANI